MKEILVCKDNKGKCRVAQIEAIYNEKGIYWEIHRESGILNGKMTKQPVIEILTGKAKRSLNQQCELEFKSHVKKYLDNWFNEDVFDSFQIGLYTITFYQGKLPIKNLYLYLP